MNDEWITTIVMSSENKPTTRVECVGILSSNIPAACLLAVV
jgi:hypothetical protein